MRLLYGCFSVWRTILRVELLGEVQVCQTAGVPQPVRGLPVAKLLVWLALVPGELTHREVLAEQLWPESPLGSARTSLRAALSRLKTELANLGLEDALLIEREQIGLGEVETDFDDFVRLRDRDDLDAAAALIRGTPLAKLGDHGGDWLALKGREMLDEVDEVLDSLGRRASKAGEHRKAASVHERRLRLDGSNEHALRALMLAHERAGNPATAVQIADTFRRQLTQLEGSTLELRHRIDVAARTGPPADEETGPIFAPNATYEATDGLDARFNGDLTADLSRSRSYIFRGVSAKYVAPRVLDAGGTLEIVRVLVLDPRFEHGLMLRAQDRATNPKYSGDDLSTIIDALRREIIRAIVALFDLRHMASIEVALVSTTSVDRIEILDDNCYVSLYHGDLSSGRGFPATLRYGSDAVAYQHHRIDSVRRLESVVDSWRFRASHVDADLITTLSQIGEHLSEGELSDCRRVNDDFARRFLAELADLKRKE